MNKAIGSDFLQLAEFHTKAIKDKDAALERVRNGKGKESSVEETIDREKRARATVIGWRPSSKNEAQTKLIYIILFLASTQSSLDKHEMNSIMESISHLQ